MVKNFIFLKIIIFSFINHIFSIIVLPFEILPRENYKLIYPENSPNDIIDTENRQSLYTIFKIGSPEQRVPLLINPTSNLYFINNITNISNISVEYRKYNFSQNFLSKYDFYNGSLSNSAKLNWCRESEYLPSIQCCSFNDDILFYDNLNMTNKKVNINFESFSDVKDNITGEIGLNIYDIDGRRYNTFLGILKQYELIDNYNWYFDLNSMGDQEGKIVIGSLPHEDYPSLYSEEDLMFTSSLVVTGKEFMQMKFTKIYTVDTEKGQNETNEFYTWVELSYDSNIILSDIKYKYYLIQKMKDLLDEKSCFNETVREFDYFRNYTYFYCKKDKIIQNKLNEIITPIYFYSNDFNYTFEITPNEILKEKGDYIFIQILLNDVSSRWSLGKIFSLKYKFIFNQDNKQIGFYKKINNTNKEHKEENTNSDSTTLIWIISGIVALGVILILLGYFLGKYVNKVRKKRANELNDEYDYVQDKKNENNNNINNVFIDEDQNIN